MHGTKQQDGSTGPNDLLGRVIEAEARGDLAEAEKAFGFARFCEAKLAAAWLFGDGEGGKCAGPVSLPGVSVPCYLWTLCAGITPTAAFADKRLAEFGVNVGLACGHCCRFCSSRAMFRFHQAFRVLGLNPFETGYAIVDPESVTRVSRDAKQKAQRGRVLLCTASDAWSPEAQHFALGRGCAEAILNEPGWILRVLTKNAAVREDFDVFERHRERVLVGLSTTFLSSDQEAARAVEPGASPPNERVEALVEAHRRGLRTYGMLCPLIAAFYPDQKKVDEAFEAILPAEPEEIFAEVVNPRGRNLVMTAVALRAAGLKSEADAVDQLRRWKTWSSEAVRLVQMVVDAAERLYDMERLRVLLYPARLAERDRETLVRLRKGLVWLK
jgi:DNA repair photolyase